MNSENSETTDPHRLLLNLTDKINLKGSDKYVALSNPSIYYTSKNIKKVIDHRSYSVSDIQDYFEYIIKKHKAVSDNPSIII